MKYTYLFINVFSILIPLARSFESKLKFYHRWICYLPAIAITAGVFVLWDYFKTKAGVWSFNDAYILGYKKGGLPLEEYLFFITIPYSCVFVYDVVSHFINKNVFSPKLGQLLNFMSFVSLVLSVFLFHLTYTFSVLFIISFVIPITVYILNTAQLDRLALTFLLCLLPMFVVNGLLTGLPVVLYDNSRNTAIRVGTIPIEDFIYFAILLSMNITIYESLRKNHSKHLKLFPPSI